MAFSSRARRGGAFSSAAAKPKPEVFNGEWVDEKEKGVVMTVQGAIVNVPNAGSFAFEAKSETACTLQMGEERFEAMLDAEGRLLWNDGQVWVRPTASSAGPAAVESNADAQAQEAEAAKKLREVQEAEAAEQRRKAEEEEALRREAKAKEEEETRRKLEEAKAKEAEEARRKLEEEKMERRRQIEEAKRKAAAQREEALAEARRRAEAAAENTKAAEEEHGGAEPGNPTPGGQAASDRAFEEAKARAEAGAERARQAFEAEKARRAAALEKARAAKAEAAEAEAEAAKAKAKAAGAAAAGAAPAEPPKDGVTEEAKAKSQAGIDRARQAYEAEKARRAAALEKARAAKAAEVAVLKARQKSPHGRRWKAAGAPEGAAEAAAKPPDPEFEMAKAKSTAGIDRARQAFEAEKARKAAALEKARAAKAAAEAAQVNDEKQPPAPVAADPAFAEAKAKSMAGIDKARHAFEAEKARKAAALEKARAAKAAEAEKAGGEASQVGQPADDAATAKARSDAGKDKARQAFEAEKARKAAALERAKAAKEAAAAEAQAVAAAPAQAKGAPSKRPSAFEARAAEAAQAAPKQPSAAAGRPSAFEAAAQAAMSAQAGGQSKRPSAFEAAAAKASATAGPSKPASRPSAFEAAAAARAGGAPTSFAPPLPEEEPPLLDIPLEPGIVVRLEGLQARADLNDLLGELIGFDDEKGRWQVRVEGMGEQLFNLKEENLHPMTEEEFQQWQEEHGQKEEWGQQQEQLDIDIMVNSKISGEATRLTDTLEGKIEKQPGPNGNDFDVLMSEEQSNPIAAQKVMEVLRRRGVCVCEANAPYELIEKASEEAMSLWESGAFVHPMQDMGASELEAALWSRVLYQDEHKAAWTTEGLPWPMDALRVLAKNMQDFANNLGKLVGSRMGLTWSHMWDGMLACYTGDRTYHFHFDNPHNPRDEQSLPDNGLRLTVAYYLNLHWNPEDGYNGGGLDVFLTDPAATPASASAARKADRLRIAPHADTLVVFLSQRMAHQVIQTKGDEKWFCLWMWCVDEKAMGEFPAKVAQRQGLQASAGAAGPADDDDGGGRAGDSDESEVISECD